MHIDGKLQFLNDTAITSSGVTATLVGDVLDLGADGDSGGGHRRIFDGTPLYLIIFITASATASTTVKLQLVSDDAAALSGTDAQFKVHLDTGTITAANATKGKWYSFPIGTNGDEPSRYLGLKHTNGANATAAQAALKLTAFISDVPWGNVNVESDTSGG